MLSSPTDGIAGTHAVIGWTDRLHPVEEHEDAGKDERFQLQCLCGERFKSWNSACTAGMATVHVHTMRMIEDLLAIRNG